MRSEPDLPNARLRGSSLMAELFDGVYEMHFAGDSLEAAEYCLRLIQGSLPCRGGFVHFADVRRGDYVVAKAFGEGTTEWIGRRHPLRDPVLQRAARTEGALLTSTLPKPDETGVMMVERFFPLGGGRHVLCARAFAAGRPVAIFELVNPNDEQPFTTAEGVALAYLVEQFATYIASHGLELDPTKIVRASERPPT
jgi:hypothetical protein